MTIEEEESQNIVVQKSKIVDVDDSRTELSQNKDVISISKDDSVRSKMEAMQKRINELKEKVKYEGELLYTSSKESIFGQDPVDSKSTGSLVDYQSKESLSQDSNNFEDEIRENEVQSDKSLYYSASSYSMCSLSSYSSDSTYCGFTKFVNNFMKNQDHKERLKLLKLHSKKQISLNMMKKSLSELESKCSEELELIEKSLNHLNKLAEELNTNNNAQPEEDTNRFKLKALDFNSSGDSGLWRPMTKASFKWQPTREGSKAKLDLGNVPAYVTYELKDIPSK